MGLVSVLGAYGKQQTGGRLSTAFQEARDEMVKEGKSGNAAPDGRFTRMMVTPREGETPEKIEQKAEAEWKRTVDSLGKGPPTHEDWIWEKNDPNSPVLKVYEKMRQSCRDRAAEKGWDPSMCEPSGRPQ